MQKISFAAASDIYDQMKPTWKGNREYLLAQVIRLVERYIESDKLRIDPPLFNQDELRRQDHHHAPHEQDRAAHLKQAIRFENTESAGADLRHRAPHPFNRRHAPVVHRQSRASTRRRSHINLCVFDSRWEASEAFELDRSPHVAAWVKNDHLGFEITYSFRGIIRKFRPDYLVRLTNGKMLVLEVKGQDNQEQQTKREFLSEWVRAVNGHGGFGIWTSDVSRNPTDIHEILARHDD